MAQLQESDFEIIRKVGEGAFAQVYQARRKSDGQMVAIKEVHQEAIESEEMMRAVVAEMRILAAINHPFIVKFHGSYSSKRNFNFVMDFLAGGELFFHLEQVERFSEPQVQFYAAEIALALSHLHSVKIIYRDLKPENCVLDKDGHVVITDFGLAKANVTSDANTLCGTAEYLAPEFLRGEPHNKAVDWWSLGILIYEMLTGELPFTSDDKDKLWEYILVKPLNLENPLLSAKAKALLKRLLDRDADSRLQTLEDLMKQEFFAGLDWDAVMKKKITPPIKPDADPAKNFHEQ